MKGAEIWTKECNRFPRGIETRMQTEQHFLALNSKIISAFLRGILSRGRGRGCSGRINPSTNSLSTDPFDRISIIITTVFPILSHEKGLFLSTPPFGLRFWLWNCIVCAAFNSNYHKIQLHWVWRLRYDKKSRNCAVWATTRHRDKEILLTTGNYGCYTTVLLERHGELEEAPILV